MRHDLEMSQLPYITPDFPDGWFVLRAMSGEKPWEVGPFHRDMFVAQEDGGLTVYYGHDRPFHLRVRSQEGQVINANDGSVSLMSYTIVRVPHEAAANTTGYEEWLERSSGHASDKPAPDAGSRSVGH
jgi:hypothetical protein